MYCIFLFPSDPELWSASNVDSWVGYLVVNVFNYQTRFPHSFNVATATAMALYEYARQHPPADETR